MCNDISMVSDFRRTVDEWVTLGDHSQIEGIGRGTVKMKVGLKNPEHEMTLREVLVVPGLSANLFSPVKATAQQKGLQWHRRMAHLSYDGLAKMADSKMVQGLPVSGADFRAAAQHSCDVCARAKQPRGPHKECSPPCAPHVLSALHVDLLEMRVPSRAGYRYVLGGVDSHSRFCFARHGPDAGGAEGVRTSGRLLVGRHAALHRHHESQPTCERVADTVRGLHRKAAERRETEGFRLQSVRIYSVSLA